MFFYEKKSLRAFLTEARDSGEFARFFCLHSFHIFCDTCIFYLSFCIFVSNNPFQNCRMLIGRFLEQDET